jgi:four helix bundle protein
MSKSLEDLEVWQKSKHLCVEVRKKSTIGPEFSQFLGYAKGSAGEVRTQVIVAVDLGYLTIEEGQILCMQLEAISRMLFDSKQ